MSEFLSRALFVALAVIPLTVSAAGGAMPALDEKELQDAIPVSEMIDSEMRTANGEEFGEIEEVVLDTNGKVVYFAVEPEMDVYEDFAELMSEETSAREEGRQTSEQPKPVHFSADDDALRIDPANVRFNGTRDVVIDSLERRVVFQQSLALAEPQGDGASANNAGRSAGKRIAASELIEKEVDLSDEDSFGSVEDVLIGADGREVVALVVDSWSGLNKHRRAIPADLDKVTSERIRLRWTEDEVNGVEEFDLDRYRDD